MGLEVLLFVPNVIGYVRLLLLVASWFVYYSHPLWSVSLYGVSTLLDAVDGAVARKLNQTSAFGAWFDIVIDILSRGMLWCRVYHFGYLVAALEWLTFVCTHTQGSEWKTNFVQEPWFVKAVMANNFKTAMGSVTIGGLHGLPVWLYCHYTGVLDILYVPAALQYIVIGMLAAGRALCMSVEVWCIYSHILFLTSGPAAASGNGASTKEKGKDQETKA